jgi:hypothetical protein
MTVKNQLQIISIISSLLLIPIIIYFKYFFIIFNSYTSNIFIFCIIFLFIFLLVYGSFILEKSNDVYFLIPQSLMFTFLARAIPNLRLSYPPLHDPYYHFVCTLNVIEYDTLMPILDWWYGGGVNSQLHWPDMHIITATLVKITDIDTMQFFRFQEPVMGIIFFMAVFLLAKNVTNNNGVALLAGLLASINDILIFYQSEYHPQGLSIIYFVLLLYTFIKSRQVIDIRYRYISLIFGAAFVLSHYFTPLFLALIFSSYVVVTLITRIFSNFSVIWGKYGNMFENVTSDYAYFIIIIVVSISYHLFVYIGPLSQFIGFLLHESPLKGQLISFGQTTVPLFSSILSSVKWGMFLLAIISVFFIFITKNTNEFRLGILIICILFSGVIGNYVLKSPLDRLIGFYVPFASIFASLTLYRFKDRWFKSINKNKKVIVAVSIASLIMISGFFNSQTPAYFFHDSEINTYYWYSNRLPNMDEYKIAGEWFGKYTSEGSTVGIEFDTRAIPFYYGKRAYQNVKQNNKYSNDYIMINPEIPYNYKEYKNISFIEESSEVYTNDEINIYSCMGEISE